MRLWVDTDYGFDDLWALLLLRHAGLVVDGISLVAGNTPLSRVIGNAQGASLAYGFDAPLHAGADRPLVRDPETAERILGPRGMQTRGAHLPDVAAPPPPADAVDALARWLHAGGRQILALGPLTNLAGLVQRHPGAAARLTRVVWMGGSAGRGNHTPRAEFNALADPHAAEIVAHAGLPLDVVDLEACRKATFGPRDVPVAEPLTADLVGGYLDIGLSRGRAGMAIYDPLAALAFAVPEALTFAPCHLTVSIVPDDSLGETRFQPSPDARSRLAVDVTSDAARLCLAALKMEKLQ